MHLGTSDLESIPVSWDACGAGDDHSPRVNISFSQDHCLAAVVSPHRLSLHPAEKIRFHFCQVTYHSPINCGQSWGQEAKSQGTTLEKGKTILREEGWADHPTFTAISCKDVCKRALKTPRLSSAMFDPHQKR